MFLFWLMELAVLVFVLISRYIFGMFVGGEVLILSLLILLTVPVFIPLIATIREDITLPHPLLTRAGLSGLFVIALFSFGLSFGFHISLSTTLFLVITALAIYFRIESRIFFVVALMGLLLTVYSLLLDMSVLAEQASIIVYLSLVIGVAAEIGISLSDRIHRSSRPLVKIAPEFVMSYRQALSEYAGLMLVAIQIIVIGAILGRGTLWDFDYQVLLYLAYGSWIFSALYLLSGTQIHDIREYITIRFSR